MKESKELPTSNYTYKPYVKNIALDDVSAEKKKETAKSFFNNIKAELNNIKNDATKLGTKDPYRSSSINGSFSHTVNLRSSLSGNETFENKEKKVTLLSNRKEGISSISQYPTSTEVYEMETKVLKLEAKLSQEIKKREELFCLLEEEKKNQTFLRDQITRIKDSHANLEKDLISKSKEMQTLITSNEIELNERNRKISKLEHDLQTNLRNYENFKKSDEQIVEKIVQKDLQISILTENLHQLENRNKSLNEELSQERANKDYEIELIIKSYEEKIPKETEKLSYKELGASFETRINELLEENFALKNKGYSMQSQIEHQLITISSLQETVDIYEERDRDQGKGVNEHELENLRNKVMELQSENDKLQSDHEFEIMKLENQIDELKLNGNPKTNENRNLNHILKDQITEIENLKEKLRQKNESANKNNYL